MLSVVDISQFKMRAHDISYPVEDCLNHSVVTTTISQQLSVTSRSHIVILEL